MTMKTANRRMYTHIHTRIVFSIASVSSSDECWSMAVAKSHDREREKIFQSWQLVTANSPSSRPRSLSAWRTRNKVFFLFFCISSPLSLCQSASLSLRCDIPLFVSPCFSLRFSFSEFSFPAVSPRAPRSFCSITPWSDTRARLSNARKVWKMHETLHLSSRPLCAEAPWDSFDEQMARKWGCPDEIPCRGAKRWPVSEPSFFNALLRNERNKRVRYETRWNWRGYKSSPVDIRS